jgi:predicted transcriptional regulator YheO
MRAREDGLPVSPDLVRSIKLGAAKDEAVRKAAQRFTDLGDGRWRLNPQDVTSQRAGQATRRKSRRVTTEALQEVVDAYRELKGKRDHLEQIAERTRHSRATVHRYLRRAQKEALLGEDEY